MTTLNANVTSGKSFTPDAQGQALVTLDDLNRLGRPTVTLELADGVAAADIKAGAVTADGLAAGAVTAVKLADAVADAILTAVATVGAENTNVVTVSVAVKDVQANVISGMQVGIEWWISDAAGGAVGTAGPTIGYTTGTKVAEHTANLHGKALTNTSGQLVLAFTWASAGTRYFNMLIAGRYVAGSIAMTWA